MTGDANRAPDHPVSEVWRSGDTVVVRLTGEVDLYNAPSVREALLRLVEESPRRLVVDLSEVSFVDSTALAVLVEARTNLADRALVLAAPGLEARRALQHSGLDRHFVVRETLAEALAEPA